MSLRTRYSLLVAHCSLLIADIDEQAPANPPRHQTRAVGGGVAMESGMVGAAQARSAADADCRNRLCNLGRAVAVSSRGAKSFAADPLEPGNAAYGFASWNSGDAAWPGDRFQ